MSEKQPIVYSRRYTDWSREEILAEVQKEVKKTRFEHILRVEEYALRLAEQYGVDLEACSLAAILHDYAKDIKGVRIEEIVQQGQMDQELMNYGSQIWHGPAAGYFARHTFGVQETDILQAIEEHTIGGENMSLVSKVLFIADYVERGREFPGVQEARRLASKDLDEACMYKISQTLIHLISEQKPVYPKTLAVYNAWAKKVGG